MGGRHAPISRRSGDYFARTARGSGTSGKNPFDAAAIGVACPAYPACRRRGGSPRERARTRYMAEDSTVLAQALASGGRWAVGARAVGRCATVGSPGKVHARADLCGGCDGLREAIGERPADQQVEQARDCRRSDPTRPGAEHLAALGGAFFKKEDALKPHRIRYWLT